MFNAQCDCGDDVHQHTLDVEYDPEIDFISLRLYFKTWTENPYKYQSGVIGWINDAYRNVKFRLKILFRGYAEVYYEFLFNNETAVQDYINALQDTLNVMRTNRANQNKEKNRVISTTLDSGD